METRANHVWVGVVTLILLALLAGFTAWLAQLGRGETNDYDIFFKQSVAGLGKGAQVTFAGVPVGQVSDIAISRKDPEFVRVRVSVREEVPMLVGTTATVQATFTGVSTINMDGARKDAPKINCETTACPEGVPVIPPKNGGFSAIMNDAPLLLERLTTLTERLNELLGEDNQNSIRGILHNTDEITASLAQAAPEVSGTLAELQVTLRSASGALESFEKVTESTDQLLNKDGASLANELRKTLESASMAAQSLSSTLDAARPAAAELSEVTLPEAEATLRDLRATSKALRTVTEKIENQGAGALLQGRTLPDYKP